MKLRFPSGKIGHEIRHYMGLNDPHHLAERPQIVRDMAHKCVEGKTSDFTSDEIKHLLYELDNLTDIKKDHVENYKGSEWRSLDQYQLQKFHNKLLQP